MLVVSELCKRYGKNAAIENVSFCLSRGQTVGLVGHNGCGKSTTMNIITGFLKATSGAVTVDGEDHRAHAASVRRKIGYLPEIPPLYLDMTVNEQLRFACDLKGIRDRERAIAAACEKADVQAVRGRLIGNLSKGYRQRVGLAQALVGNPPLLILDEPTAGLDPAQIVEMKDMIRLMAADHAVLMSSHVLAEVSAMCDRLVVLSNGRMVADEKPRLLQERFRQEDLYEVEAAGGEEALLRALSVPPIRLVHKAPGESGGTFVFRLQITKAEDPAGLVYARLKDGGGKMLRFACVLPDLESVFLSLTRDQRYEKEGQKS